MTNATAEPAAPARSATTPVFIATFAGILVATALLLALDLFLARVDQRESGAHAVAEYQAGRALLASGHPTEAGEHFGSAVGIDRRNVSFALALAEAMVEQGRLADAEVTLRDLLERAENDGAVNLTMAHTLVRERKLADAKAYFHRAIFGRWGADSVLRRTSARLELIDVLVQEGAARELLAELLPLEEASPDSVAFRVHLGQLFIAAGAPRRAATTFRAILSRDPQNPEAHAGIGRAALEVGNLQAARAALATALRLRPDDRQIAAGLAMADSLIALDPTARGLRGSEQYARAQALLTRTIAAVASCSRTDRPPLSDALSAVLSASVSPSRQPADAEALVRAAIDVWGARPVTCASAARDTVLRLIHVHLAP